MRVDDDFFDHRIADVHEMALEFVGEFLFPVRTDDERGAAKVHFADLILEVETVRGELDFCFDVVIQRVCFLRDFFAECFRRVVRNEQLLREKTHVVHEKLGHGNYVLGFAHDGKTLAHDTAFENRIGVAFQVVEELRFVLLDNGFRKFFVCTREFSDRAEELCRFSSANWQNRVVQQRNVEFLFEILGAFEACPRRN